ncbi:MAG: response regulator [Ileibacterium sp.]|nr:response regulator [Ileibacterium sp.]
MNNERNKSRRIISLFAAAFILVACVLAYASQLQRFVELTTLNTVKELSSHDLVLVSDAIESNWKSLEQIALQIQENQPSDAEQTEKLLNLTSAGTQFSDVYLIGEDGTVYSSRFTHFTDDLSGQNTLSNLSGYFKAGQKKMVSRYDTKELSSGDTDASLIYGILLKGVTAAGQPIAAIAGICDLKDLNTPVLSQTFENQNSNETYSAVVDSMGRYVMGTDDSIPLDSSENLYTDIEESSTASIDDAKLASKMETGQAFSFTYQNSRNEEYMVVCLPFEDPDIPWYLVTRVEYSFFSGQSKDFVAVSALVFFAVVSALSILLLTFGRNRTKEARVQAQAQSRMNFLNNISHEIRSPLNSLIGVIHLMRQEVRNGCSQEQLEGRLEKADHTASYLMNLVNNMMDFSKMQKDKAVLFEKPVSLTGVVNSVWEMEQEAMESRQISGILSLQIIQDGIVADDLRLKQVLTNLLSNAVKFTGEGGEVELRVEQSAVGEDQVETTFVIKDTGIGMQPDFAQQIWSADPDQTAYHSHTESTGLGMTITKQLLDAMHAKVDVVSAQGVGTIFTVRLISKAVSELEFSLQQPEDAESAAPAEGKILIAEDNEFNAEILMEILQEKGFETAWAKNGTEAVEIFRNSSPYEFSSILMDMKMPEMDGSQAASIIRSLERPDAMQVLILACTASIFMEEREKALNSGMDDFLSKPVDPEILVQKLKKKKR